tara:strand:+ start:189333 stop:189530 length:198 start_codon:yes stop_codon:yes gene_type:complete
MEILVYIITFFIFVVLLGGLYGMWTHDSSPMTDEQLYGMSADEYSRKMMGEETYKKYLNEDKKTE